MTHYYFLLTSLPEISLDETPSLSFEDTQILCHQNLPEKDLSSLKVILEYFDLKNLHSYFADGPINAKQAISNKKAIEDSIEDAISYPQYVYDFLIEYDKQVDRLQHFSFLYSKYFQEYLPKAKGFLKKYLEFEREWRLVMLGFRAKQQKRDLASELRFEDEQDPLIIQIMAQKDAQHYEPPFEYSDLKPLFEEYKESPLDFEKYLIEYRLSKLESFVEGKIFNLDKVLSYLAKLLLIVQWHELNAQKGKEIVETMVKETK